MTFLILLILVGVVGYLAYRGDIPFPLPHFKPKPELEPYFCPVQTTRDFEWKLVGAGVLKAEEMTTCNNSECRQCHPPKIDYTKR